jgi:hypothetical protein
LTFPEYWTFECRHFVSGARVEISCIGRPADGNLGEVRDL